MNSGKIEINLDSINWNYEHQDLFYLPQWQTGSKIHISYVMYRVSYASFYVTVFLAVVYLEASIPFSLQIYAACYYTCWNFFMCAVQSIMSLVCVLIEYLKQKKHNVKDEDIVERKSGVFYKIQWIMLSIVTDSSIAVSVGYFSLVHTRGYPYIAQTAILHLWVPILVIMDFMICSMPAKLLHGYASLLIAFIYAVFTYIYYLCGGLSVYGNHYLYKILDYKENLGLAIFALVGGLFCVVMGRVLLYCLFLIRHKLFWKYYVLTTNPLEVTRFVYEINK